MRRRTFDAIVSIAGLMLALVLLVAGGLLAWASDFVDDQVSAQLASQKIFFPEKGSASLQDPRVKPYLEQYVGQQLTTGAQAKAWADHYIAVHLGDISGGKTYSELSAESRANPDDEELRATVDTVFRGTTLRSMLLSAYAFGQMGTVAFYGAVAALVGSAIMFVMGMLGMWHLRRVPATDEVRIGHAAHLAAT